MKKTSTAVGIILLVLIASFVTLNKYVYDEKQASPEEMAESYEPYRATLAGEYMCLPHVDSSGPQTMECAFGLKTDAGEYYAVDFSLMSQTPPPLSIGDRLSASGLVTPIERLSTDHWRQYPIQGIFSLTDSVEKL
jgi:hypothetical protein